MMMMIMLREEDVFVAVSFILTTEKSIAKFAIYFVTFIAGFKMHIVLRKHMLQFNQRTATFGFRISDSVRILSWLMFGIFVILSVLIWLMFFSRFSADWCNCRVNSS